MRPDGRRPDQLRPLTITPDYLKDPEGSALIRAGETWVICTASVENKVPPFLKDSGKGWVTGEYAMLPRSTTTRSGRGGGGRAKEIERLVGRALRASIDLAALGQRTITVDCDVLQADGGTRTASITGGYVALAAALIGHGMERHLVGKIAAVSVGIVDGRALLDLDYSEDSHADVDFNVVGTDAGTYVELQGTAEGKPFDRPAMDELLDLAGSGLTRLFAAQAEAIASVRR